VTGKTKSETSNGHGGRRRGAGRKRKWDMSFKIKIGKLCERLSERMARLAFAERKNVLFEQQSDIAAVQKTAQGIAPDKRKSWRASPDGQQHADDMEEELATLNRDFVLTAPQKRVFTVSTKPKRGTRKCILSLVARKYLLSTKQVDNMWQFYRSQKAQGLLYVLNFRHFD